MNREATALWERAQEALESAEVLLPVSADRAASNSYYAAFHAVSGLFAEEGKTFAKHTAVEAAVHRELIKTGRWSKELGVMYSELNEMRRTGDYGGLAHVTAEEAKRAVQMARRILEAVRSAHPGFDRKQ